MATVEEMKNAVREALEQRYKKEIPARECTPEQVESKGYLLSEHARAVSEACRRHSYSVSFREAGAATLQRIRQGHPCKGHTILDKSVKPISGSRWTYDADGTTLDACRGLVGFKADNTEALGGLWFEQEGKPEQAPLNELTPDILQKAYTGDYDMHDLLRFNGDRYARLLAETVDELSAIDRLNSAMLRAGDKARSEKVAAIGSAARLSASEYSLIRHGAQTSFMCYLHSITGSKELKKYLQSRDVRDADRVPWQEMVMNISAAICMFDKEGRIFILDAPGQIYWYYKSRDMLNQIPFYYFFKELGDCIPRSEYAQAINCYLRNFCSIPAE